MAEESGGPDTKRYDLSALLSCILFGLVFLFLANHENLWYDEIFSLQQIRLNWEGVLSLSKVDVHPYGYPVLLKVFSLIFGSGIFTARLFSVLLMTFSGILIYHTGKILSRPKNGLAAMLLFYLLPGTQFYALEIRMYAAVVFFMSANIMFTAKIIRDQRGFIPFIGVAACAFVGMSLHYGAAPVLMVTALWGMFSLLRQTRWRSLLLLLSAYFLAALLYSPCLLVSLKQFQCANEPGNMWCNPLSLKAVILTVFYPFTGYFPRFYYAMPGILLVFIYVFYRMLQGDHKNHFRLNHDIVFLFSLYVSPLAMGFFLFLLTGKPMIIERSMIPGIPGFALAFGLLLPDFNKFRLKLSFLLIGILISCFHLTAIYFRTRDDAIYQMREYLQNLVHNDDVKIYYADYFHATVLAEILPQWKHTILQRGKFFDWDGKILKNISFSADYSKNEGREFFILGEHPSPESFAAEMQIPWKLQFKKNFINSYRGTEFRIYEK